MRLVGNLLRLKGMEIKMKSYIVDYWIKSKYGSKTIRQFTVVKDIQKAKELVGRLGGHYYEADEISTMENLIKEWAIERGLDKVEPSKQMVKLMEETGELASGIARDNKELIKDSLGDVYVVMVILALRLGLDLQECIEGAYNEIKDRKGKLVNGVFIKETDLKEGK
jgi:NTP pyrophosphatase (non-canonical NTP hydrolase)